VRDRLLPLRCDRCELSGRRCGDGVLYEARFVDRVRMNRDLNVHRIGDLQARIDGRGRCAPVFVELQAARSGADLFLQRCGGGRVALSEEAEIYRPGVRRFQHASEVPGSRRARRGVRAGRGTSPAADHRCCAVRERLIDLLRRNEMNVAVDCSRGDDHVFARDHFRGRADD